MRLALTKERIEQAFDLMGRMAAERALVIEIAVYGGSCLILASNIRVSSADVDAVFLSDGKTVREIADAVGLRLGIGQDWINEAVRQSAPPRGNPRPNLLPFGEFPRSGDAAVGLRVYLPTPAYMRAMKLLANRLEDDFEKIETDQADAVALMKVTGIDTREALLELLKECYSKIVGIVEPSVHPRIAAKLDALMDAYAEAGADVDPTWNAGRGPATRS